MGGAGTQPFGASDALALLGLVALWETRGDRWNRPDDPRSSNSTMRRAASPKLADPSRQIERRFQPFTHEIEKIVREPTHSSIEFGAIEGRHLMAEGDRVRRESPRALG